MARVGRPKLAKRVRKSRMLTIRLTESEARVIWDLAKRRRMTPSEWVREAIACSISFEEANPFWWKE